MGRRGAASWLMVSIAVVLALLPSPGGIQPAASGSPGPRPALALRAHLATGEIHVIRDGVITKTYPLATVANHRTPRGEFIVRRVVWEPMWSPLESSRARRARTRVHPQIPSGRVRIAFQDTGYMIHATTDPGSFRDGFTHRCLSMREADLIELARLLVREQGPARPPTFLRRVLGGATGTMAIKLDSPVELTIR